jgi:hypothetical protein
VLARASIAQPLASWDDSSAKQAIVKFVTDVSTEGAPTFLAPSDRIAVFDNDGTLWSEQPLYFQFMFSGGRYSHRAGAAVKGATIDEGSN